MTREQLEAMRNAAQERANEFDRKSREMHRQRQYDTAQALGVSYSVALLLAEMCNEALKVTS